MSRVKSARVGIRPVLHRRGNSYLIPISKPNGPSCGDAHKSQNGFRPTGAWAVLCPVTNQQFLIDPPTQMQKDIWLSGAKDDAEKTERAGMLRWYCFECGTLQEP